MVVELVSTAEIEAPAAVAALLKSDTIWPALAHP
jgi:hypothetical protein